MKGTIDNSGKIETTEGGITGDGEISGNKPIPPGGPTPPPMPVTPPANNTGGSGGSFGGKGPSVFSNLTSIINSILEGNLTGGISRVTGRASGQGSPALQAMANRAVSSVIPQAKAQNKKTADVIFSNAATVPADVMASIASQAQKSGLEANVVMDNMNGNAVGVRIRVSARAAAQLGRELNLSATVGSAAVEKHFAKYYRNKIAVVAMAQKGSFGVPVDVADRVDLSDMDTAKLHFYTYDAAANAYREIPQTNSFIDGSGYLHFNTSAGNNIVISEGDLTLR